MFDLIEETTHLLRTAPLAAFASYYAGAVPFVVGLLFFWADMSRSPFASQHLAQSAFALAALFAWMKFWQAVFARRLRAQLAAEPWPGLGFRRAANMVLTQTILQPAGLFLIPMSLPAAGWTYTLFQNVTVLDEGQDGVGHLLKRSWKQAALWPRQNHLALGIGLIFGVCVFLNWATVCVALPFLIKMLFGIGSAFTQSIWSVLNTTFLAAICSLTYLCVDPIFKAMAVLRCFYGESLRSGEDLKAQLKVVSCGGQQIAALALVAVVVLFAAAPRGAAAANVPQPGRLSASDLDSAIQQTIHQRKYTWRMPRDVLPPVHAQESVLARFFHSVANTLDQWAHAAGDWLQRLLDRLFRDRRVVPRTEASGPDWAGEVELLLYCLAAVVIGALTILLYRVWRERGQSLKTVAADALRPTADLADDAIEADHLSQDGWTKLGQELLERGEFRPAIRAFYLASLADLAGRNIIRVARFKSNRDYERELCRRAHALPGLLRVFSGNVAAFEQVWYGRHEADRELAVHFAAEVERLKTAS